MDCMDFCSSGRDLGVFPCVCSTFPKDCLSCSWLGCRAREGLWCVRDESGAGILLQEQRGSSMLQSGEFSLHLFSQLLTPERSPAATSEDIGRGSWNPGSCAEEQNPKSHSF